MRAAAVAILVSNVIFSASAMANARCDGHFELVHGSWIATPRCLEAEAEQISRKSHMHISDRPRDTSEWTPEEFCRWNKSDIETGTYCAPYVD